MYLFWQTILVLIGLALCDECCETTPCCDDSSQNVYHSPKEKLQKRCPPENTYRSISGTNLGVCTCKDGYYWKDDETCVKEDECCGVNRTAVHTYVCEERCPSSPQIYYFVPCVEREDPDNMHCKCLPGHVVDMHGDCIKLEDCPECGRNETYSISPTPCPNTCFEPNGDLPCVKMLLPPQCVCKPGHVLNVDGVCIHKNDCPKCDGPNEEYIPNPPPCPNTCDNREANLTCKMKGAKGGCACKKGYLRNREWICVPEDHCNCE